MRCPVLSTHINANISVRTNTLFAFLESPQKINFYPFTYNHLKIAKAIFVRTKWANVPVYREQFF